jgi:hypothetical protein
MTQDSTNLLTSRLTGLHEVLQTPFIRPAGADDPGGLGEVSKYYLHSTGTRPNRLTQEEVCK